MLPRHLGMPFFIRMEIREYVHTHAYCRYSSISFLFVSFRFALSSMLWFMYYSCSLAILFEFSRRASYSCDVRVKTRCAELLGCQFGEWGYAGLGTYICFQFRGGQGFVAAAVLQPRVFDESFRLRCSVQRTCASFVLL